MSTSPTGVGVIGCGIISNAYLEALREYPEIRLVACGDLRREAAEEQAARYGIPEVVDPAAVCAHPDVEIVLNLTIPAAHFDVSMEAVRAGRHVYTEKPLTATLAEGRSLMEAATKAGVRVGSAPDTFMGRGIQTARAVVESGEIGRPVSASAAMVSHGPEGWHTSAEFYYAPGGGPLLDMGPYYLTALVYLIKAPVARVVAMSSRAFETRTMGAGPRKGASIPVEVETHVTGLLEFTNGAVAQLVMSFDTWRSRLPRIEIHGTEGSLAVPDPNNFDGDVDVYTAGQEDRRWRTVDPTAPLRNNRRGIGLLDMAEAIREGRPHLANGDVALHVLEVMDALLRAAAERTSLDIASRPAIPEPVRATANTDGRTPA